MAIIPAPKTHSDVAMNQHLIPRCYMKAWKHNSGNDPKVWLFDKSVGYCESNPENSDWTLRSFSTKEIMAKNGFHDIKAGFSYMPDEALHEIYDDILQVNVVCDGKNLNSPELLNQYFYDFDKWEIKDSSGIEFTEDEKRHLKEYFNNSRWTFVETEWAHTYENNWGEFIQSVENKIKQAYANRNTSTSSSVTQGELNTLMKYCMIYNWRSIAGNEIFNSIYDFIPFTDELKNVIIPEADRTYEDDVTAYDQMKHASIIKAFVDYLQSDSGKMKTIESAFMQRVAPVFLMTNDTNPFITSDVPSFTRDRADGLKDIIFVATPTLAIGYGRGETGKFIVSKFSQNEVLEYNKSIAKYGNKLVIKDQNYDVKQLFVGISKRIT